jgi:hypothetical protein
MPVVGISINKVEAKREENGAGNVSVKNNTALTDIKEVELSSIKTKGLAISFEFKVEYHNQSTKKDFATILIGGDVLYISDKHDEVLNGWKKSKKAPDEIGLEVINNVLRRCITKALVLAEDVQLPPPISLPYATVEATEEKGKGKGKYIK